MVAWTMQCDFVMCDKVSLRSTKGRASRKRSSSPHACYYYSRPFGLGLERILKGAWRGVRRALCVLRSPRDTVLSVGCFSERAYSALWPQCRSPVT